MANSRNKRKVKVANKACNKKHIALLFAVVILGAFLRFHNLGEESLWLDECLTLKEAERPTIAATLISVKEGTGANPPLFFVFMRYWIMLAGESDFWLRFPSAVMGIISICLVFILAKDVFGKEAGIVATFVMAVSMLQVLYSQEARQYAMLTMLMLLSWLYYARSLRHGDYDKVSGKANWAVSKRGGSKKLNKAMYVIFSSLLLYTHYFAAFGLLLQNAVVFMFHKELRANLREWILSQIAVAMLCLPVLWFLEKQFFFVQSLMFGQLSVKYGLPAAFGKMGLIMLLIPLAAAVAIIITLAWKEFSFTAFFRKRLCFSKRLFFWAALCILAVSALILKEMNHSIFVTRYTHFYLPLAYILVAKGFLMLERKQKAVLAAAFILVSAFLLATYYSSYPRKAQWEKAAGIMEASYKEGDFVLISVGDARFCLEHYYSGAELEIAGITPKTEAGKNTEELESLIRERDLNSGSRVWLILSHAYNSRGLYESYLKKGRETEMHIILRDIEIFRFS